MQGTWELMHEIDIAIFPSCPVLLPNLTFRFISIELQRASSARK
jgi:hypothetical protein